MEFEQDIFALHDCSFACLLDGKDVLRHAVPAKSRFSKIELECPKSLTLAENLYEVIGRRSRWGFQDTKHWVTRIDGRKREFKGIFRGIDGEIGPKSFLKMLVGRTAALGTYDGCFRISNDSGIDWLPPVNWIRFDIDQDRFWDDEDRAAIMSEVRRIEKLFTGLGLPVSMFRTGRRGIQVIVPLPTDAPHSVASFILPALRSKISAVLTPSSVVDADNLSSLMRLPGGYHNKTGKLGLFIDSEGECLFDQSNQERLMIEAFKWNYGGGMTQLQFVEAGKELVVELGAMGIPIDTTLSPGQVLRLRQKGIGSQLAQLFGIPGVHRSSAGTVPIKNRDDSTVKVGTDQYIPRRSKDWAERIWKVDVRTGQSWQWMNAGGQNGIGAALLLFGEDGLRQLEVKLSASPNPDRAQQNERLVTARKLWSTFDRQRFVKSLGRRQLEIKGGVVSTAKFAIQQGQLLSKGWKGSKYIKKKRLLPRLIFLLDTMISASADGVIEASCRQLAEALNNRYILETNDARVHEALKLICDRGPGEIPQLFVHENRRSGLGESATFRKVMI